MTPKPHIRPARPSDRTAWPWVCVHPEGPSYGFTPEDAYQHRPAKPKRKRKSVEAVPA